ncbi:MAG: hypothetical protein JNL79_33870 [Myxococcales bacterium]|nr:hypothetical protein [Myxococcales bacterium]
MNTRWSLLSTLLLGACGTAQDSTGVGNPPLTSDEAALNSDGEDAKQQADTASSFVGIPLRPFFLPKAWPTTAEDAATKSATVDLAKGCMTNKLVTTTKVEYVFVDCVDPRGELDVVSGTLQAEFGLVGGTLSMTLTATGSIVVRPNLVKLNLTFVDPIVIKITPLPGGSEVTYSGKFSLERPARVDPVDKTRGLGGTLTHDVLYQVVTGADGCLGIPKASWKTDFSLGGGATTFSLVNTITNYRRCPKLPRDKCPETGGSVRYARTGVVVGDALRAKPLGLTIDFLGGRLARFTPDGKPATTRDDILTCTP